MRNIHYKSNYLETRNAIIWIVIDLKCRLYKTNKFIILKQYSKGKIVKNLSSKYIIAEFEDGKKVKINKKYVLINLPDVLQKEVIYSITNATSALYNINGSKIPEVTGKILYKDMILDGKIKAPLMYRTAEKLYKAEQDFLKLGLSIKIYDTYRPYSVTKYLYEKTLKVADEHIEDLNKVVNGFEYSQRWFLAEHASSHNYGVAIDMTLVNVKTNEELEMQTQMHNLSVFSVVDNNNNNAKKLAKVMKKNKFNTLRSEWWHFQDNSSKVSVMDFFIK